MDGKGGGCKGKTEVIKGKEDLSEWVIVCVCCVVSLVSMREMKPVVHSKVVFSKVPMIEFIVFHSQ